ncbi:MAG TPA: CehA/McbA family metallohydrolase [Dongiaceae bacterium]|nr:CehA/McbA family metallohydrolase [Dongiaceae bacterium]
MKPISGRTGAGFPNRTAGWLAAVILQAGIAASTAQEATLRGTIRDEGTGALTPCTVTITDAKGKLLVENGSFNSGFRCSGRFTKALPPGRTRIRVTRGFETEAVERQLELPAGRETELTLVLRRRVDLRRRGWYGGDSHAHMLHGERTVPVDFDFVALTARAEDLQYLCLAQNWTVEPATPEALEAELKPRSTRDCLLNWNLEAPKNYYQGDAGRCLGHCWNLGMRGRTAEGLDVIHLLLEASAWDYESSKPTYANFESQALIHSQGGAVFYTHPARWWMGSWGGQGGYPKVDRMRVSNMAVELPLDTLAGPTYDGLDVLTTGGESAANAKAFQLWSLLLNHGYRLAATASSDACFDRPGGGVPGIVRTYTFVTGQFSLAKVAQATAAGRTFATTGPLLIATLDGAPPGCALAANGQKHVLAVEAWACGSDAGGIARLELLRNGQPFKQAAGDGRSNSLRTEFALEENESAWYCVRVLGSDAQRQIALSGAFYFAAKNYRPPLPVRAQVQARIVDAQSGECLPGSLTEVTLEGPVGRDGKRHRLNTGQGQISVPATVRLRAEAVGHAALTLSPFLDSPKIVQTVTGLADTDLLDWKTFEQLREQLGRIDLVFRLHREPLPVRRIHKLLRLGAIGKL